MCESYLLRNVNTAVGVSVCISVWVYTDLALLTIFIISGPVLCLHQGKYSSAPITGPTAAPPRVVF